MLAPKKRRVLIVDDHPVFRGGVVRLLERHADLEVCGEADTPASAMGQMDLLKPDVLLLDLSLGQADGLELIKQLRETFQTVPILVVSMHSEETYAERVLRAGAEGYIMKHQPPDDLVSALRLVLDGKIALTPRMSTRLLRESLKRDRATEGDPISRRLSDRELHVFRLIGSGLRTGVIAAELNLSPKTIETYRENLKDKLGLKNGQELQDAAVRWVNGSR